LCRESVVSAKPLSILLVRDRPLTQWHWLPPMPDTSEPDESPRSMEPTKFRSPQLPTMYWSN
jgi:hypothetical protein